MTRLQKIERLERQLKVQRMNHKSTAPLLARLVAARTRDLIANNRALRRARRAHG